MTPTEQDKELGKEIIKLVGQNDIKLQEEVFQLIRQQVLNVIEDIEKELPEPRSLGAQAYCRKVLSTLNQIRKRYSDELR